MAGPEQAKLAIAQNLDGAKPQQSIKSKPRVLPGSAILAGAFCYWNIVFIGTGGAQI
jgi:hypothetical protein